ncbi:MAG TPA: hypothetical protein VFV93_13620 [Thermomicrobiales bacterium]|nr:hypothetical protein [Thermomicrobiales bacterium]
MAMRRLLDFLDRLENEKIWYRLEHIRDSIMVESAIPGERWEIEFFADGHVEVERFRSDGQIGGDEMLDVLFRDFSD